MLQLIPYNSICNLWSISRNNILTIDMAHRLQVIQSLLVSQYSTSRGGGVQYTVGIRQIEVEIVIIFMQWHHTSSSLFINVFFNIIKI